MSARAALSATLIAVGTVLVGVGTVWAGGFLPQWLTLLLSGALHAVVVLGALTPLVRLHWQTAALVIPVWVIVSLLDLNITPLLQTLLDTLLWVTLLLALRLPLRDVAIGAAVWAVVALALPTHLFAPTRMTLLPPAGLLIFMVLNGGLALVAASVMTYLLERRA